MKYEQAILLAEELNPENLAERIMKAKVALKKRDRIVKNKW